MNKVNEQEINRLKKLYCQKSLYYFAEALGFNRLYHPLHYGLCKEISNLNNTQGLFLLPRGVFKTTLGSITFCIWLIIQDYLETIGKPGREIRILLAKENATLAEHDLASIESILDNNEIIKALFPDLVPPPTIRSRWNRQEMMVNRKSSWPEATITTIGVGGAAQGMHFDCIGKGCKVWTSNGLIPIEEARPHLRVLTEDGHHHEVLACVEKQTDKKMYSFDITGEPYPLICTEDHKILTYKNNSLVWELAKNVDVGDMVALPIPNGLTGNQISRVDQEVNNLLKIKDIWRLIGYWLAEGAATQDNGIRLTFGLKNDTDLVRDAVDIVETHLGVKCSVSETKSSTAVVRFFHKTFKEILNKFGTHSYNKHVPPFVLSNSACKKAELIKGYFRGDGCKTSNGNGWMAVSVSESLLQGMKLLLASVGIPSIVRLDKHARTEEVCGNVANCREIYSLHSHSPLIDVLMGTHPSDSWFNQPCWSVIIPGFLLQRIKGKKEYTDNNIVYDVQVNNTHSFVASGVCVHNCIIYDDIIGDDAKNSDTIMERTIEWFDYSQSLLISPTQSLVRIYGTRWSKRDVYQHIIDNYPRVKVYTRSIIENNQSIFPELYPLHILDEMRERNPVHYYGQLCNNPIDPGKCEFKPEWLKKYEFQRGKDDELLIKFEDDPLPLDIRSFDIVGAYDPSVDESPKASRRAIVYTAMDSKQRVVILDCYASRESVDAVLSHIFSMFHRWHPRKFSIESVALSRIYIDLVQKEAQIRNTWIAAQPFKVSSRQSKDSRIRDAIQQVAAEGRLYCLQSFRDLQQEFIDFPNGRTKDILDALSMCIQTHQPPVSEEEKKYADDYDEYILQSRNKITGY